MNEKSGIMNSSSILKPLHSSSNFRSKTPLVNSKQKKNYRNITIQQLDSDDIGHVNRQH